MEEIAYRIIDEYTNSVLVIKIAKDSDEISFISQLLPKSFRLETISFELEWKDILIIKSQTK